MALFGRTPPQGPRHSTALDLADPVRHADWNVQLGRTWRLVHRNRTLAVVEPDRSYSVRSTDGLLLNQIDSAVIDDQDLAAAAFVGLPADAGPNRREKLRIRDTRTRIIAAECHHAGGGILVRLLPNGPANPALIARSLPAPIVDALIRSGPWVYRTLAPGEGELRRLDRQLVARDFFTRSATDPSDRRGGLIWWSIRVEANPLPSSWLFALLLACEQLRR
jgi:hypothetical protein